MRELAVRPIPGDRITLAADTVVTVREIVAREEGDTIAAEVAAEVAAEAQEPAEERAVRGPTESASRSLR